MTAEDGYLPDPLAAAQTGSRRSGFDRRVDDERRRTGGLFEVRARRERIGYDRRRGERREQGRFWLAFWRREG